MDVASIRKQEIGFKTINYRGNVDYQTVESEAIMLTGDGNILSVESVVQYKISDPEKFAFNIKDQQNIVKFTVESVLRERVAARTLDEVLTFARDTISLETTKEVQQILDSYNSGVKVDKVFLQEVAPPQAVLSAFDDVNNAKQDKERFINEANKYSNDLIPKAQGKAEQIVREAEAYASEKVLNAEGETDRFLSILKEYEKAPDITEKRLKIEAIQNVLQKLNKVIITDDSTIKFLNLNDIKGGK